MHRRTLLKLLAATAVVGCDAREDSAKGLKVVVAGAGIIGASIAYHLAKAGASVTVIDKEGPASHASRGTFAWINATWAKQPQSYHTLSQSSVSNWRDLAQSLDLPVRWGGSLEWFNNVERQVIANSEARRLRASSSRAAQTQGQASSKRLTTVEAENRQLRRDLEEAEQKLEAITSIERSIREQE
jgi:glycine/D-amino acid oxidase-like deaminating enzyme